MPSPPKDMEALFDQRRDEARGGPVETRERGERPSWRELDRKKDRSSHSAQNSDLRDKTAPTADRWQSAQAQKELKGQLNALWRDRSADEARLRIGGTKDPVEFQAALDGWIAEKGSLPADPELLQRALESRKDTTVSLVVDALIGCLPTMEPTRRKVILTRLTSKARTTFDNKLATKIRALLASHGA